MTLAPVTIVVDHPARHLGRRFLRWVGRLSGVVLLVTGLAASVPAVPASLAVISFVIGWATTDPAEPEPWPTPEVPVREIVLVWMASTALAVGGIRLGLRAVRHDRRLVLFLRRFGYDDAQSAISFAVVRTIGASWRVVTLDDAEMVPVGVPAGTRTAFRAGRAGAKFLISLMHFLGLRMFPILVTTMWGVVALALLPPAFEYVRTGATTPQQWSRVLDPFFAIVGSVFEWQPPLDYVSLSLPGVFAVLAMAAVLSFVVMIASAAALMLALPLSTVLFFLSSSADAVGAAEADAHPTVNTLAEVKVAAARIARLTTRVLGPRIVVLRVATPVWQQAVHELAAVATLPLIDISDPTENVVWEIAALLQRFGHDCIFIGHYDRVQMLAREPGGPAFLVESRVRELLAGREVLAYTTDDRGLRRFARALRGTLITRYLD